MPLTTAPATMTVATASGNTVFSLIDLSDNQLVYRAGTVGGSAIAAVKDQPVLTITRRPATRQSPNVKYTFVLDAASYDALGGVIGRSRHEYSITEGANYTPVVTDASHDELAKALGLAIGLADVQSIIMDGSGWR